MFLIILFCVISSVFAPEPREKCPCDDIEKEKNDLAELEKEYKELAAALIKEIYRVPEDQADEKKRIKKNIYREHQMNQITYLNLT